MKLLVIPSLNGFFNGLDYAKNNIHNFDKVVFLGNIFGEVNQTYEMKEKLFLSLLMLKAEYKDKIVVCIGDCELSFYLQIRNDNYANSIKYYEKANILIQESIADFNVMYQIDDWTFSYAGVSQYWNDNFKKLDISDKESAFTLSKSVWSTDDLKSEESPVSIDFTYLVKNPIKNQVISKPTVENTTGLIKGVYTFQRKHQKEYAIIDTKTNEITYHEIYY